MMIRPLLIACLIAFALDAANAQDALTRFAEAKATLEDYRRELDAMRAQYTKEEDAVQRQMISTDYKIKQARLVEFLPGFYDAALAAYLEKPNENPSVNAYVVASIDEAIQDDRFDDALRISAIAFEHRLPDARVDEMAGTAAFMSDRFDEAKAHLAAAQKAGHLSERGMRLLASTENYIPWWADEQAIRKAEAAADDLPRVRIETSRGLLVIELYENQAPNTVANFITLVEKGFYDGTPFHRVLPHFMAQGGDPTGTGRGGAGHTIKCECVRDDFRRHFRGTLSMAHAGRNTGSSQFFLTFVPTNHLDSKHTAFGRVIEGLDVLAKLHRIDPQQPDGSKPDLILSAKVLRKRDHPYTPETSPSQK